MIIYVGGQSHLAQTIAAAARMRGFDVGTGTNAFAALSFAAEDVLDHEDLKAARAVFDGCFGETSQPVVLVSQVPPGTTRKWAGGRSAEVFYQVDTIIMRNALPRVYAPQQIIVGCADPNIPLPLVYQEYVMAHDCPVLQMSYESAEMVKCSINYMLAKQIEAANELAAACEKVGAIYDDVRAALHNDARIGQYAYLRPGKTNQHLDRDIKTLNAANAWARGQYDQCSDTPRTPT